MPLQSAFTYLEASRFPRCILLQHPASAAGLRFLCYLGAVWDNLSFCKLVSPRYLYRGFSFQRKSNRKIILRWSAQRLIILIPLFEFFINRQITGYAFCVYHFCPTATFVQPSGRRIHAVRQGGQEEPVCPFSNRGASYKNSRGRVSRLFFLSCRMVPASINPAIFSCAPISPQRRFFSLPCRKVSRCS